MPRRAVHTFRRIIIIQRLSALSCRYLLVSRQLRPLRSWNLQSYSWINGFQLLHAVPSGIHQRIWVQFLQSVLCRVHRPYGRIFNLHILSSWSILACSRLTMHTLPCQHFFGQCSSTWRFYMLPLRHRLLFIRRIIELLRFGLQSRNRSREVGQQPCCVFTLPCRFLQSFLKQPVLHYVPSWLVCTTSRFKHVPNLHSRHILCRWLPRLQCLPAGLCIRCELIYLHSLSIWYLRNQQVLLGLSTEFFL